MTASEAKPSAWQWKPAIDPADRKALFWSFFFYVGVFFPLFVADRYNVDDWGRAVLGYYNWGHDGRPLSDWLMQLVDNGKPFTDCSPLPQLLAILCLCLTGVVVAKRFNLGPPLLVGIVALTLGANPFYVANLSFKFDALPMSLGLLLAASAALDLQVYNRRPISATIVGTVFLYACLCLYQPCFNAFLVLTVFEVVQAQRRLASLSKIGRFMLSRFTQALAALLLYKVIVAGRVIGNYALEHAALIGPDKTIGLIWRNLVEFWSFVFLAGSNHLRWPILIVPGLTFLLSCWFGLRYLRFQSRESLRSGALCSGLLLATGLGFILAAPGILLLVESPTGGARTYVGFSVFLFASVCYLVGFLRLIRAHPLIVFAFSLFTTFPLISFTATYANAMKTQKNYEAHIANLIGDDLAVFQQGKHWTNLTILGDVGYAPSMRETYFRKYPVLGSLVAIDLRSDASGGFGNTVLKFHGTRLDKLTRAEDREALSEQLSAEAPVKVTPYYEIYTTNGNLTVRFNPNF